MELEVPRLAALVTSLRSDIHVVSNQLRPDVILQDPRPTIGACERILEAFTTVTEIGADMRAQLRNAAQGAN